ncbi:MAG TPA: carboxymuconolactone decarboxylase family protein [Longimicrobiaceae bacterium]
MSTAPSGSDGIALLRRERPEVLESYLHLLGSLGKSLDPRTRQLILLALQVTQGSTRALRRHVPRAREAGATPDEVLDAIALALPVAGLTRVSEAVAAVEDLLAEAPPA